MHIGTRGAWIETYQNQVKRVSVPSPLARGRGFPEKTWRPLRAFRHAGPACASHADRLDPASSLKGDALQPHINPDSDKNFGNWYKQLPARPGGSSTGFAITYFEAALPRQKPVDFLTWSFHLTMMIYTRRIL